MGIRLDRTCRGRLRANSFDPNLTCRASTYFDRGLLTIVTKVKLAHLVWASSTSVNGNPKREITFLALAPTEYSLSSGLRRRAISSTFGFPNSSRKAPDLALDTRWCKVTVRVRLFNIGVFFFPLQLRLSICYTAQDKMKVTINRPARHKLGYQRIPQPDALPRYTFRLS